MMARMQKDLGKRLYIDSGYRSPGRQLFLFFYYLSHEFGYSLKHNAAFVAFPGYSEHGNPYNTACDLINLKGISGEEKGQRAEDFTALPEYEWMLKNASKFNFYLSYPKGNPYGITFEPWHWRWKK
jgi:D-alanyl-D-alanine carboxypeptidase